MIQLPDDRRPPLSPQLAMRVALLGGFALVMFGIIFFRLWFLEVLSGDRYLAQAKNNQERRIVVQAPRGQILDRNGNVLVDNRAAQSIQVLPQELPRSWQARRAVVRRLAAVVGASTRPQRCRVGNQVRRLDDISCQIAKQADIPYAAVTVEPDATPAQYDYLYERRTQFPGVQIEPSYIRLYPFHDLAAQLFGTVGQITAPELRWQHFQGVTQGTVVGQSGIEYDYDRYLRGENGYLRVAIDALGNFKAQLRKSDPVAGNNLRLSLDLGLQREGEIALDKGIGLANANGNPADAGAFVAIDPRDGSVLAMGSHPSFDPNVFAKPISVSRYDALFGPNALFPQINRAMSGYPTGSTFKPFTATAALESGTITPDTVQDDPGQVQIGNIIFHNAGNAANGALALRRALQVSSDVFFYRLGAWMNSARPQGGALQTWARRYGIGSPTGIDLPGEQSGILPSPGWRAQRNEQELRCRRRHHGTPCGISDLRLWSIGDNVNTAVGQGDVLATPLQMAVAYSAIENGGRIVRPHLGLQVEDAAGRVLQRIATRPVRRISVRPDYLQAIRDGLRLAASPGGTSGDVFGDFPRPVFGKTGTAQHVGQADQSWYVCFVPDASRPIVIAVTIEKGGFGAQAAAPAARLMLSQWFHLPKKLVAGKSRTL